MTQLILISALAAAVFLAFIVIKMRIYLGRVESFEQKRQPESGPSSQNSSPNHYPDISSYPRWSIYLAVSGGFVSLTALFALVAIPKTDPASMGENILWALFVVGFFTAIPLVCFRLGKLLYTLGDMHHESNKGFNRTPESSGPAKPGKRGGGAG